MNRIDRIYKNNMLLPITLLIICVQVAFSSENPYENVTVSVHSHKNTSYDVTTFYRLTKPIPKHYWASGFKSEYTFSKKNTWIKDISIEIHSRTNAIGMPIATDNEKVKNYSESISELYAHKIVQNTSLMNVDFNPDYWRNISIRLTGEECKFDKSSLDTHATENELYQCFNALEYMYGYPYENRGYSYGYGHQTFLKVHWRPVKEETCLALTYYHRLVSNMEIVLSISDENGTSITSSILEKYDDIVTLKVTNISFLGDQNYDVDFKREDQADRYGYNDYSGNWFGLLQIAQCSNDGDEQVKIVSIDEIRKSPKPFHLLELNNSLGYDELPRTGNCSNGGHMHQSLDMCVCPPGFKGRFCEIGCGPNYYGADCKGICSMYAEKMCRGIYMCTNYGCTCPAGLTGSFCDKDCRVGTYGADCKQKCALNCHSGVCDSYTGICSQGCRSGYVPPYCTEKYPYLISPPKLISNEYETMVLQFDFRSDNIKGGKNTKIQYYQLSYKAIYEEKFTNTEPKLLEFDNKNDTTEILNDLKPDTTYLVGALVITDEGNFNDEDIVYGQYRTSCIQPELSDYNISLISGVKNISITWNNMTHKPLECNVIEYVLTLSYNGSQNKISGIQEIVSSSNSGHIIDDLIPGYQYSIVLTPKTNRGPLIASPSYLISPLIQISENDVAIKDIVTSTDNEKIKITWKLVNSNQPDIAAFNVPVSLIVKYKINRILSCSLKELEKNWTTTTVHNQTHYEIFNTIPNSQYSIQVALLQDNYQVHRRENIVYALTPASEPKTEPDYDIEHSMYVTNNSAFIQWKIDPMKCSKLNGFFSKFFIQLEDAYGNNVQTYETRQNNVHIDGLQSNTPYRLKVFIKTHIGYNHEHFLLVNFTTKIGELKSVTDLVVYKKSLKYRMVGLRWSYPEAADLIDGFLASFNNDVFSNGTIIIDSVIPPTRCSAWPDYYCHTFNDLSPSNNHTFKIQPRSLEYPKGGKATTISFKMTEELPGSPSNITIIETGKTFLTLQWDIPWIFNGVLNWFTINVEEISATNMTECCTSFKPVEIPVEQETPSYNFTIMSLKPGSTYSVGVVSVSKSYWYSSPARIQITTLLDA